MAGVQIIGREAIVETFSDCGYDVFSLSGGKTFVVGSGLEDLGTWIDRFCPTGVSGNFVMKLYNCELESVRANTECMLCFNCRVMDGYGSGIGGFNSSLSKRLEALEKGGSGKEEDRMTEAFMGWLEDPAQLLQVVGAVKALFSSGAAMPATIGAVIPAQPAPGQLTRLEETRYQELAGYLDRLEKADPNIVTNLGKLANIAENEPATFKMLLGMMANR